VGSIERQELQGIEEASKQCIAVNDAVPKGFWTRLKEWLLRVLHDDRSFEDRHW